MRTRSTSSIYEQEFDRGGGGGGMSSGKSLVSFNCVNPINALYIYMYVFVSLQEPRAALARVHARRAADDDVAELHVQVLLRQGGGAERQEEHELRDGHAAGLDRVLQELHEQRQRRRGEQDGKTGC